MRTLLAALLFAMAPLAPASAAEREVGRSELPDWVREAYAAANDREAAIDESAPAEVLLDAWEITVDGGGRHGVRRGAVLVREDRGAVDATLLLVRNAFREFDRMRVWSRDEGGRVTRLSGDDGTLYGASDRLLFEDVERIVVRPRRLAAGSVVAFEYRFKASSRLPQDVIPLERDVPVRELSVRVRVVGGGTVVSARCGAHRTIAPAEVTREDGWLFRNLPAVRDPDSSYAPRPRRDRLVLDYAPPGVTPPLADWAGVARWNAPHYAATAGAIAPPPPSPAAVDAAIASAIRDARAIRYFGIELGMGGFVPRPPATTAARGFGDCKDKTLLAITALRAAGVRAWPALTIAPQHGFVDPAVPALLVFDHVVVAIPWTGLEAPESATMVEAPGVGPVRLVDVTLPTGSPLELAPPYAGAPVLVVADQTTGLARVPDGDPEEHGIQREIVIDLEGRDARVSVTERRLGVARAGLENELGEPLRGDDLRALMARDAAWLFPGYEQLEVTPVDVSRSSAWTTTWTARWPGALQDLGAASGLAFPGIEDAEFPRDNAAGGPQRVQAGEWSQTVRINVGARPVLALPEAVDLNLDEGRVVRKSVRGAGAVTIAARVRVAAAEYSRERAASQKQLRAALEAIAREMRLLVQLVPGGAPK